MAAFVVTFGGGMLSGKSSISSAVAEALGWPRVGFGDYVRSVARAGGLADTREALQEVGVSLISEGWEKFCRAVLSQARWSPGESLVVDGVRHREALDTLASIVTPSRLVVVHVALGRPEQEQRLKGSGVVDSERRRRILAHSTEVQAHAVLPRLADFTVDGGQAVKQETARVVEWLRGLGAPLPTG
jgi:cytidylate kinase